MLDEPIKDGEGLKINGSVMMAAAETAEEVLEKLKKDVYAKEVWDFEKVQIIPVRCDLIATVQLAKAKRLSWVSQNVLTVIGQTCHPKAPMMSLMGAWSGHRNWD